MDFKIQTYIKGFYKTFVCLILCLVAALQVQCQERKLIQLSGLVVGGDSLYGIPGAYLYVSKSGRGTTTNYVGFFSLPAVTGDTITIKAIGFKQKQYIIPGVEEKLSVMLELTIDTTFLPTVEIFPWATEKSFKEAFLSLNINDMQQKNAMKNLNEKVVTRMLYNLPDDGTMNYRYFLNQQNQSRYPQSFNFLDPIAWHKFIKSVRKGELKAREEQEYREK